MHGGETHQHPPTSAWVRWSLPEAGKELLALPPLLPGIIPAVSAEGTSLSGTVPFPSETQPGHLGVRVRDTSGCPGRAGTERSGSSVSAQSRSLGCHLRGAWVRLVAPSRFVSLLKGGLPSGVSCSCPNPVGRFGLQHLSMQPALLGEEAHKTAVLRLGSAPLEQNPRPSAPQLVS